MCSTQATLLNERGNHTSAVCPCYEVSPLVDYFKRRPGGKREKQRLLYLHLDSSSPAIMPRVVLLLLCCALRMSASQGCGEILYSTLGESVLFPCERNVTRTPIVPTAPPLEENQDRLPTQWHFLAPSGEMHPLAAWLPNGRVYKSGGTRRSRVVMLTDASLQVGQLQLGDAGQYICYESNILGHTTFLHNVTLIITGSSIDAFKGLPLLLGILLGSKCLILILVVSCTIVFGRKKEQLTYVNVTE